MFQARQSSEINPLVEISRATVSPGAVGAAATVIATVAFAGATFTIGDQLEIFPAAGAATAGILVSAAPSATVGSATVYFQNNTAGSITPASGIYTVVATRFPANIS